MKEIGRLVEEAAACHLPLARRHQAFGKLVARFQDMAYGCACAVLGDFDRAQDAAQEAFIAAWDRLGQLREPEAFPGWLRKIVLTRCTHMMRGKHLSAVPLETAAHLPSSLPGPQEIIEREERRDQVWEAILSLAEHERMAITLFYIDGRSQKEVAAFLEIPLTTVKKRLHDARRKLRERMISMVEESLEKKRPSKDKTFVEKVIQLIQPQTLEGSDVWEMVCAALTGDAEKVRSLIAKDPALARCEYWYTQPIHFAVREGHVDAARALLEAGADPTYRGLYGEEDLLTMARDRGHEEVVRLLEAALAERFRSSGKDLEIHRAVSDGDLERVRSLIAQDRELVNIGDSNGNTPLHRAVEAGRLDLVAFLLDQGAEIDAVRGQGGGYGAYGFKPIDLAIWKNPWGRRDNFLLVGYLLARGAAYTITIAAAAGDLQRVRELLAEDPALANDSQPSGKRPLSAAAERGHTEIVRLLLEHGANPTLSESPISPKGYALWAAARRGDLESAGLLLKHGADPNGHVDAAGPPTSAARDKAMRALMYRYGGRQTLWGHIYEGNIDAVAPLLDTDPDLFQEDQGTPSTAKEMVEFLLSQGAQTNLPDDDPWATPLAWAEKRGHGEIARILRKAGAKV